MWLLSCDGELFGGKPIWLRPGSTHLLGRTSGRADHGERVQYIEHKSVSRKHLVIRISDVTPGDSAHLHTRSQVTVEDGSKLGTTVNGEKIVKTSKLLDKTEYDIRLGSYEHTFHLKWTPIVLTFTGLSKSSRAKGDALAAHRKTLEPADVKIVTEYVTNGTTHVIAKKRNTPAGLQALVQGRWLLVDGFVQALSAAVARPDQDGEDGVQLSPLEDDFLSWPKEDDYILPVGSEPVSRPNEYLKPNPERSDIFSNFTFVFLAQSQYDNLLGPITAGGGKAVLWDMTVGESNVFDLVRYVNELGGVKGRKPIRNRERSGEGGAVVVRLNDREDTWTKDFLSNTELALDQRAIEQSEFLDVILTLDVRSLRKPLEEESGTVPRQSVNDANDSLQGKEGRQNGRDSHEPESSASAMGELQSTRQRQESPQEPSATNSAPTTRRPARRIITQSRFKFEELDPSQFTRPASNSPEPEPGLDHEEEGTSEAHVHAEDDSQAAGAQQKTSRKRPTREEELNDEQAMMDDILQGANAMKKRRLLNNEIDHGDATNGCAATSSESHPVSAATAKVKQKNKKQIDVLAELQARRDHEEEQRRKDEESLRNALEGVDISELKNLAKVEEFDVPLRDSTNRRSVAPDAGSTSGKGSHWDPSWDGRKNFKKFRPKGQRTEVAQPQRIIVTLEEVPRRGHGLGDEYWLQSTAGSNNGSRGKATSQSQSRISDSQPHSTRDQASEESATFHRRLQYSRDRDAEAEAEHVFLPGEVAGQPRDPAIRAALEGIGSTPSQTLGTASQRVAAGKRPAAQQAVPSQTKKARRTPREVVQLDDDDDGLTFRRRRK